MKQAAVIQHVPFEDLGNLKPVLERIGYQITYYQAGVDELSLIGQVQPELLVILGGPIGVYEEEEYPFIRDELKLIQQRLAKNLPILGICLGCQLLAKALGAKVYPGHGKEIGWGNIQLSEQGQRSYLRHFDTNNTAVLHWHGDTFDLPEGAVLLASSELYRNQAFAWGNCLGLQFHPEVTAIGMERWFIGHACEIASTNGISVSQLRRDTQQYAPALQSVVSQLWNEWLDSLDSANVIGKDADIKVLV